MATIRTVQIVNSKKRRRIVEGVIEVCCHRVYYYYDVAGARLSDDDLRYLEEEAESRSKDMIVEGCNSGDLCCLTLSPVKEIEREFYGWWKIQDD